jgi:hypothetical protein
MPHEGVGVHGEVHEAQVVPLRPKFVFDTPLKDGAKRLVAFAEPLGKDHIARFRDGGPHGFCIPRPSALVVLRGFSAVGHHDVYAYGRRTLPSQKAHHLGQFWADKRQWLVEAAYRFIIDADDDYLGGARADAAIAIGSSSVRLLRNHFRCLREEITCA